MEQVHGGIPHSGVTFMFSVCFRRRVRHRFSRQNRLS